MSIDSIAQRDVVVIDAHATLEEAAQLMRDRHIGSLVVTRGDAGEAEMVGIVTDRDLALRVVADGVDPQSPVEDVCSDSVVAVLDTASMAEAAQAMHEAGVRRLVLVDRDRRLRGIVTLDDLIASYAEQLGDLAGALDRGREQEAEADTDAGQPLGPVLVPSDIATTWRRMMEP